MAETSGSGNGGRAPWLSFQPTVSLGGLIHLVIIVASIAGAWATLNANMTAIGDKIASLERKIESTVGRDEFNRVTTDLSNRSTAISDRVDRLSDRVGRGP
jgi:ABC-type transporter Mla subunit MlaD